MRHEHKTRSLSRELIEKAIRRLGSECLYPTVAYDGNGYQIGLIWYDAIQWHGADLNQLKALVNGKHRWYDGRRWYDVDYARGEEIRTTKGEALRCVASWRNWAIHHSADNLADMPLRLRELERANLYPH